MLAARSVSSCAEQLAKKDARSVQLRIYEISLAETAV